MAILCCYNSLDVQIKNKFDEGLQVLIWCSRLLMRAFPLHIDIKLLFCS